jgi:hypothetical protein
MLEQEEAQGEGEEEGRVALRRLHQAEGPEEGASTVEEGRVENSTSNSTTNNNNLMHLKTDPVFQGMVVEGRSPRSLEAFV